MDNKQLVEIARSFSYKLNTGNYESRDFFCSQKAEVPYSESEETSNALYHFCKTEVMKSVNQYIKDNTPESEKVIDIKSPNFIQPNEQEKFDSVQDKTGYF